MHVPLLAISIPAFPMMVIKTMLPIVNFELFEQFAAFKNLIAFVSQDLEFDESPPKKGRQLEELPDIYK